VADERRTEIVPGEGEIDLEDLIAEEEMVISITSGGYIKRLPVSTYRAQRRGGKGLRGVRLKDDDYIQHLFIASTHHYLLFFTNQGRVYRQKVHELPQGARDSRGRHIANVLALQPGEEVRAVFATRDYTEGRYLVLATRDGMVKKTEMRSYDTILREAGLTAINLEDGDELVGVQLTDGDEDLLIVSARGQAARFHEGQARPMGRATRGVKAMTLDGDDRVLAIAVARDGEDLLVVTGNGYGKRTPISDYPRKGRPTKGVRTIKVSDKKGELVAAWPVREGQELLLMSQLGKIIRIETGSIRRTGRSTEGVRLMDMGDDDQVSAVASVVEPSAAAGGDDDGVLDTEEALEGAAADAEAEDLAADAVEDVLDGGGAPEGEGP
jgi:DNA gyrase subunit A